ncbi:MAG: VOC family protein [Panacibacter sp.]
MGDFQTSIVPTLSLRNGAAALEFYKKAFGAVELMCITGEDGSVVAELAVDGARFFIADESPEHGNFSPETLGGISIRIALFVSNPDAVAANAMAAGASEIYPVADQDYGYRLGCIKDPFGHVWEIGKKMN